ncbi:Exo_endo_phos domain-containing protein [Cephalotus follicularis]|uniref:Exo_endo_phos domain-containing protein n=1 Tax=Cephalotus follicularis TaxID=3775 RepID=A0A1Q3BS09_CEPFO|nr:Exo_endo_phos domain-containing protein [Cephalotus follicularis]
MIDQAIHGKVVLGNETVICLSFVYGLCDYRSRRDLWKDLIFNAHIDSSVPWLILGDFNVSRYPQDQLNGPPRISKAMSEFNECLKAMEVDDIQSVGRFYTWSNKRAGNFTVNKKLDRVLANWEWHNIFSHSLAHFHNSGVSDHSPVTVPLLDHRCSSNKPFKFLNFWVKDARFSGLVRSVWEQRAVGKPLEAVLCKLRNLKRELKSVFNKPNPSPKREALREEIECIQSNLLSNPSNAGLLHQEKLLLSKLWKAKVEEESFLKQKSRISWLRLGDSNTKFFHRTVSALHHRNHIGKLQKSDGSWISSQPEIEQEVVAYFSGLLGEQGPPVSSAF